MYRSTSLRLVVKRVLHAIPVMWAVTLLSFALLNLLPGGSALVLAGPGATDAEIQAISVRLHLNQPFWDRYYHWLTGMLTGHFGTSFSSGQPISTILATRLPVTAELVIIALTTSVIASIVIATLAVRKPHGIIDRVSIVVCISGLSIPGFVLGLIMILIFAVHLRILPAVGFVPLSQGVWPNLRTMIMPSATLAFALMCNYTRVLRADLADQINSEDYVTLAQSKGVSPGRILIRHALRNSIFGLITLVGLNLGVLLGGTVLIEQIFSIPGVGSELITAVTYEDVTVVEAIVVILAAGVVISSLITDLLYSVLDPRIRYGRTGS